MVSPLVTSPEDQPRMASGLARPMRTRLTAFVGAAVLSRVSVEMVFVMRGTRGCGFLLDRGGAFATLAEARGQQGNGTPEGAFARRGREVFSPHRIITVVLAGPCSGGEELCGGRRAGDPCRLVRQVKEVD